MVDDERITQRIGTIQSNLRELGVLASIPQKEFLLDTQRIASAKYFLQVSVEAMIDIGNHIIARLRLGTPESNFHTFELLARNNIINKESLPTYQQMVKFRNLVVHLYHIVDNEEIYRIIHNDLKDFELFIKEILSSRKKEWRKQP